MRKPKRYRFNGLMVRMLREQMELKPHELAAKANITVRALYNIEHGKSSNPRLLTMGLIAEALDLEVHQLIFKVPTV